MSVSAQLRMQARAIVPLFSFLQMSYNALDLLPSMRICSLRTRACDSEIRRAEEKLMIMIKTRSVKI